MQWEDGEVLYQPAALGVLQKDPVKPNKPANAADHGGTERRQTSKSYRGVPANATLVTATNM